MKSAWVKRLIKIWLAYKRVQTNKVLSVTLQCLKWSSLILEGEVILLVAHDMVKLSMGCLWFVCVYQPNLLPAKVSPIITGSS